jgi:hypothetical protein
MRCPYFDINNERAQDYQNGLTNWGYLPGQWRLANVAYPHFSSVAYPHFSRQRRVNDGGSRTRLTPAE